MAHAHSHAFHDRLTGRFVGWQVMWPRIDVRLLIVALCAALLGAAFAPGARYTIEAYRTATDQTRPAAESMEPAQLPREWRWQRKAVAFEHMYGQKR